MTNIRNALMQAAGSASGDPVYVEDVYSTTLYTGNNSAQTITTGLDISGEGGTIWFKQRVGSESHRMLTTTSATYKYVQPDTTDLEQTVSTAGGNNPGFGSVTSTGFTLVADDGYSFNKNDKDMVSWSFRKQKGFFDVVKWDGDGNAGREISHSLGSTPGMIAVKRLGGSENWLVYHANLTDPDTKILGFNLDAGEMNQSTPANLHSATASKFEVGNDSSCNSVGQSYIGYVWASGTDSASQIFGDDGDEAIIKCGSYTGTGAALNDVSLGFEPQWLLIKQTSASGNGWFMLDSMRGVNVGESDSILIANTNGAELSTERLSFNQNGFTLDTTASSTNGSSQTYIYMAIRRGPMKEATAGTDLLDIESYTGNGNSTREFSFDITPDFIYQRNLGSSYNEPAIHFRVGNAIKTAGAVYTSNLKLDRTKGAHLSTSDDKINQNSESYIMYAFKRFPKAIEVMTYESFDETSLSSFNQPHNLGVQPELMMSAPYYVAQGSTSVNGAFKMWWQLAADNKYSQFTSTDTAASWFNDPTATHIPLSTNNNQSFYDVPGPNVKGFIVILFASVEGIIKIGEYSHAASGDYTTVSVTTGFQPRFIMLQHDDNGSWTQFDSVQGLSSSNNPHFEWASTSAQTTSVDVFQSISSTGFVIEHAGGGNSASFNYGGSGRKTRYIAIA